MARSCSEKILALLRLTRASAPKHWSPPTMGTATLLVTPASTKAGIALG